MFVYFAKIQFFFFELQMVRIFRDRGQLADYENDEVFAYFVGWIAGEIAGFIKKALL
jgi:hypothetical protein